MSTDIACIPKYLPAEQVVAAALTAAFQNPANQPNAQATMPGMNTLSPEHLAVMTAKYWGAKGVFLTVGFMEQINDDLANRIVAHMNAWQAYANVVFTRTKTDPKVRITRNQDGFWSYLGTDILHIDKNEATMCLQGFTMQTPESEFKRVVRHETGHTLGFPHEHMRAAIIAKIDPVKAIKYFRQTQGWSAATVQEQVLKPLAEGSIMGSPDADETSIMTYSLPGIITKNGQPIIGGNDIAEQDIEVVGRLYPKVSPLPPPEPLPPLGVGITINFDLDKKVAYGKFPSGWKFQKMEGSSMLDLAVFADELEAALPQDAGELEAAKQGAIGGVISQVLALVTAIRSGDYKAIALALRNLLNTLLGDDTDGEVNFAQAAHAARLNWAAIIAIITKLLPILLGGDAVV